MSDTPKPSNVSRHPDTLRRDYQPRDAEQEAAQVELLTTLFRDLGERQLVPVIIHADGRIIDGHCRVQALKAAGRDAVWVSVWRQTEPPTHEEVQAINASQSTLADTSPGAELDRWAAILAQPGWTPDKLAKALGRSVDVVTRRTRAWAKIDAPTRETLKQKAAPVAAIVEAGKAADARRKLKQAERAMAGGDCSDD